MSDFMVGDEVEYIGDRLSIGDSKWRHASGVITRIDRADLHPLYVRLIAAPNAPNYIGRAVRFRSESMMKKCASNSPYQPCCSCKTLTSKMLAGKHMCCDCAMICNTISLGA